MPPRTLPVLRLRTIAKPSAERWTSPDVLPADRFDEMLGWLRREGWRGIDPETLTRAMEGTDELSARAVLITFDGGCRSLLDEGLSSLIRHSFPAMAFVPTDFVGLQARFNELDDPVTVCTWEELRVLQRNNVSIESMGTGRRRFTRLEPTQQEREIMVSRDAIEAHVGKPVEYFAYPKGDPGRDPEAAAEILKWAGYRAAFTLGGGVNVLPGADPYRLARIPIQPDTDLARVLGE